MQKVIHVSNGVASFFFSAAKDEGRVFRKEVEPTLIVVVLTSISGYA